MNDSLKFAHLQGMLTGEARTLIDGYLGTDADYWSALASLEQRYGDPTQLKLRLNAQLNNVKPAENTLTSARQVFDQMDVLLRQLAVAGEDINTLSMVTLVQKRLPNWLLIELHRYRDPMQPDYVFSIDELRQGVSYILRQREQIASIRGTSDATQRVSWCSGARISAESKIARRSGQLISLIDYMLVSSRWAPMVEKAGCVQRSVFPSDHRPVTMRMKLRYVAPKNARCKRYDMQRLTTDAATKERYQRDVLDRLYPPAERRDVLVTAESFTAAVIGARDAHVPELKAEKRKPLISSEPSD
ncbi:Pao retrotransposon peptidase family protein-like protein [Aphelenchoides avenae]|nr:Pao retrotransposon peptidase family protein-like protein [Aphelenchus avenae]